MSQISETIQRTAEAPGPAVKAINYMAALLSAGSFLGLVNLVVGVLSAGWLAVQLYGYFKYEIPRRKRQAETDKLEQEIKRRELARLLTKPGELCD